MNPETQTLSPKLTREELAKHYQVSLRTVDEWRENRIIPYLQNGRVVRFDLAKVDKALEVAAKT